MGLVRLCYVSEAIKPDHLVRQDLMDIITEAVIFNTQHDIYGVLYYGHGYFFQCLEGSKDKLELLFHRRIESDQRHRNIKVLQIEPIHNIQFKSWNMKFAPYEKNLMKLFEGSEEKTFNPYLLENYELQDFLNCLHMH